MANINFNAKTFPKLELGNILSRNKKSFTLISKVSYDGTWYEGPEQGGLTYVEREGREYTSNELYYFSRGKSTWYEDGESGIDIEWEICRMIAEQNHHFEIIKNNNDTISLYNEDKLVTELPTTIWNKVITQNAIGSDDHRQGDEVMIYEYNYQGINYQLELYNFADILGSNSITPDFNVYEQLKYKGSGTTNSAQSDVPVLKFMDKVMWKGFIAVSAIAIGAIATIFVTFEPFKEELSPCDITFGSTYLIQSNYNDLLGSRTCSGDEDTWQCFDYKEYKGMSFIVNSQEDKDRVIKFMNNTCEGKANDVTLPLIMTQYSKYYSNGTLYHIPGNYRIYEFIKNYWYWGIVVRASLGFIYFTLTRIDD